MPDLIPEGTTYLLLVEGKEDQEFFISLGRFMSYDTDNWLLRIIQYGGKTNLTGRLQTLARPDTMERIERIGIVRDADFNTDAFSSVKDAIRNSRTVNTIQLPVPARVRQWTEHSEDLPSVGVLILPSDEREGMIEDLIMDVFKDDPVSNCVAHYFGCLQNEGVSIVPSKVSKARLRTFITGKNISTESEGDDSDKGYLSDIYKMSWWQDNNVWQHQAFDEAKAFLAQLLA